MRAFTSYHLIVRMLLLATFFLAGAGIYAQRYPFKHYDADNGLPSSDIFHVIQDSKGYIWIATDNGVSRFNGYEFVNYGIQDGLPQNTVLEIFEDSKNRIWFVSIRSSLSYFKNGKIYPYKYNNLLEQTLKRKAIPVKFSFFVDSLDNVYMTSESRRMRLIDAKGTVKDILPDKLQYKHNFILEKNHKLIMTYYADNLSDTIFYIHNNKRIALYVKNLPHKYIKHFSATKLADNKIFIALGKTVYEFKNFVLSKQYKFKSKIFWIQKDSKDNLWIADKDGGVKCFLKGKIKKEPDIYFLKDYFIASVFEDNSGGYWFASLHNGVYYLPDLNIRYFDKSNYLYRNNVNTVFAQNDSLWIGYHANYVSLIAKNKVQHFKINEDVNLEVSSLVNDKKNNRLLVGTQNGLFFIKNGKSVRYVNSKAPAKYPETLSTKDIAVDWSNGFWLAGRLGFYHVKDRKILFDSSLEKNFSLRSNAIYVDKDNSVWLGSIKGLWRFNNNYLEYMGHQNPLLSIRVMDIVKYQNKLTLGTKGGGIIIIEKDTILQINTEKGLNSNTVTSLSVSDKYLWAGTKKGLSRIFVNEKHEVIISNYTKAHGLLTNEIRQVYAKDSFLYISSNKGLMQLNVNRLKKDTLKIPIYFEKILINNKSVPLQKEYKLKYNQNNILIKFEAISFNAADELMFRYIMSGLDSICSLTKSKELRFSFLPPGKYTFELSARNRDNIWNKQPEKITFIIEKPFWLTNWFRISVILSVFILIYLFFKYKTQQIHRKNEMQRELNIYIKQALVNHMNPHFMFNSLSRINHLILNNDKAKASEYLSKFSRLMRVIIENSKKEYIPIYEEIKSNRMYMEIEASRMEHDLDYEFIIDDEIDQFNTKVPSLLIQPFIENAIWYGIQPMNKKGKIIIRIRKKEKYLSIEIQDNGIGRKKSVNMIKNNEVYNNQSKGTEISFKRIQLLEQIFGHNTKIEYVDIEGAESGTIVILDLPLLK